MPNTDETNKTLTSPIMNVPALCAYLGVGRDAIYALAARDEIPHFHVGRYLRFRRDELDEWSKGHQHKRFTSLKSIRKAK